MLLRLQFWINDHIVTSLKPSSVLPERALSIFLSYMAVKGFVN
jgi:hypothetical protein